MYKQDKGLTHVAFQVSDLTKSVDFYQRYADMKVIHQREATTPQSRRVAWLSDLTRSFAIVLVEGNDKQETPLGPFGHLGVACGSPQEVDDKVALARKEGCLRGEPTQSPPPVGYWVFLRDPDGNTLELSYGQTVEAHVAAADD